MGNGTQALMDPTTLLVLFNNASVCVTFIFMDTISLPSEEKRVNLGTSEKSSRQWQQFMRPSRQFHADSSAPYLDEFGFVPPWRFHCSLNGCKESSRISRPWRGVVSVGRPDKTFCHFQSLQESINSGFFLY